MGFRAWHASCVLLVSRATLGKLLTFSVSVATFGSTEHYQILISCQVASPVTFGGPQGVSEMGSQPCLSRACSFRCDGEREQAAVTWQCPWPAGPPKGDMLLLCLPVPHMPQPLQTASGTHRGHSYIAPFRGHHSGDTAFLPGAPSWCMTVSSVLVHESDPCHLHDQGYNE